MKRTLFLISILAVLITLTACNQGMKVVKTKDFAILLPKNAQNHKGEMLENAVLEYADTVTKIQITIERKSTKNFIPIDSAREIYIDDYLKDDAIKSTYKVEPLKDKNGYIVEAETITLNQDFSTWQTFWVVGLYQQRPNVYYVVWTWTDRIYKPDNQKMMEKIVKSFKILKK